MAYNQSDTDFLLQLGKRIRYLRESRSWSQEDFAVKCDLHRTYIGAIERGERNVAVLNLRKIALALEIPLAQLFMLEG